MDNGILELLGYDTFKKLNPEAYGGKTVSVSVGKKQVVTQQILLSTAYVDLP